MRVRFCPKIIMLVALLALFACSRPAIPGLSNASAPNPPANPTAQSPTRTPARPTPKPAASQPTTPAAALAPTESAAPPALTTIATEPAVTAVVKNGGNVRATPVTGNVLDQVNAKETVRLLRKNAAGTWYQLITPRNVTGWVSATLLRIDPAAVARIPVAEADAVADVPSPAAATVPSDWKTYTIEQNTLQLPPAWQSIALTKADLERAAKMLDAQNPALAQVVRQLATSGLYAQFTFFALETQASNTGANINLIEMPRPQGVSTDKLLQQALAQKLPNSKIISSDNKHQVNGLPAGRVVYDSTLAGADGKTLIIRGVQWYILSATQFYIITVSGKANDALITVADQIGHSFTTHAAAASTAATTEATRQVIHGGNMRQAPKIIASNVIGQVCPGDQVALLDRPASAGWSAVRIVVRAPDCDPTHVPAEAEGWVSSSLLGPLPQDGSANLPPSLPITKLIAFTHDATHISGLRPENWTIFGSAKGFQISSSPEAPDGFTGHLITPSEYPADGAAGASRALLESLKHNQAAGPAPQIMEDHTTADGGTLFATVSSLAQGSTQPVRMTVYARTTITPTGVLVAIAIVPADLFPQEEALIRQMVDSLHLAN